MTIVTQDGNILNYAFIRSIAQFEAKTDDGDSFVLFVAQNDKDEEINIAAYDKESTADKTFEDFLTALERHELVFRFPSDEEKPFTNRFIDKDR